jgi:hypothetical protein
MAFHVFLFLLDEVGRQRGTVSSSDLPDQFQVVS